MILLEETAGKDDPSFCTTKKPPTSEGFLVSKFRLALETDTASHFFKINTEELENQVEDSP